jgi:hypothetical protein
MKRPPSFALVLAIALSIFALPARAAMPFDDWKPLDPGEVALNSPTVEKDADAEALFWEIRIDDNPNGDLIFNHYIRIKVFTDRGKESQSKIDIPFGQFFGNDIKIKDIAARTIKADGSIVELKKDDVFERTMVKVSGAKVKAKSFAMPAVEPGCIIEYRWREVRENTNADNVRLMFQRDIPVRRVQYLIKPYAYENRTFNSLVLHGQTTPFVKEKGGFYSTTMTNVPALHEESKMPPEDQVKIWMLVFYQRADAAKGEKFWQELGKRYYEAFKQLVKVNDDIKQRAAALTADAKSDDEKLQKLYEFCRNEIKNASNDASGLTPDDRKKVKENKTPSDTLKRGIGSGGDIDLLFAALATAAGFDARIVLAPDRGDIFFDRSVPNDYFLRPQNIGVNVAGTWKFFNPGYNYIPFGMLRWQEEGEVALLTDQKAPSWVTTPMSPPEKSLINRQAKLTLSDDGTLEGDVTVQYTGHFAIERKEDFDADSDAQREEDLKEEIKNQMSAAEISNIKIENVTDHVKPLIVSYHVRFPGYATRTGKRLFLQPAFFQHGLGAMFSMTNRRYPVYFHYPWSEDDNVEIALPTGYALDSADAPALFGSGKISEYKPSLATSQDGKFLLYKRKFFFGGEATVLFPETSYPQLKQYFDTLHKQDNHTLALKQTASN